MKLFCQKFFIIGLALTFLPFVSLATTTTRVLKVTTTAQSGTYATGQVIPIQVQFSDVVTVQPLVWYSYNPDNFPPQGPMIYEYPKLKLRTGSGIEGIALYKTSPASDILNFEYQVGSQDKISGLDYISTSSLSINKDVLSLPTTRIFNGQSGQIVDSQNQLVDLTLPTPGETGSLVAEKRVNLDSASSSSAPTLSLTYGNKIAEFLGDSYYEPGYLAVDDIGGDVSALVGVLGSVDMSRAGNYTLTYNATDTANNLTSATRQVAVVNAGDLISLTGFIFPIAPAINRQINLRFGGSDNNQLGLGAYLATTSDQKIATFNNWSLNTETISLLGDVKMSIATGTIISGPLSWSGQFLLPAVRENSSVAVTADAGMTANTLLVLEIGDTSSSLSLNQAARILFPAQANNQVGFIAPGGSFQHIDNVCPADTQDSANALSANGDCRIAIGDDLVVWTKHFSRFAVFSQTQVASGGGGGSSPYVSALGSLAEATARKGQVGEGEVLGVKVFGFGKNLSLGAKNLDVKLLQLFLIVRNSGAVARQLAAVGPTGYFGVLTKKAVAEFQMKEKIKPTTGYFGPMTRERASIVLSSILSSTLPNAQAKVKK